MLGSISFSYQLQADSFNRISFELRAFICAALPQTTRIRNSQLYNFQVSDQNSFQLTGFQLSNALASGGVQQSASQNQLDQPPCSTRTFCIALTLTALSTRMSAWILHSLSLALGACKASSSKIAWSNIASNKSLLTIALSTTSSQRTSSMGALQTTRPLQTTSFHRSASKIAFEATSSRRLASTSALTRRSLSTTSSFGTTLSCFSFLVHNFSFNNILATCQLGYLQDSLGQEQPCKIQLQHDSFSNKKIEKKNELQQNFWNRSLRKCLPIKLVHLVLMIILNKSFGKFSFRNSAYSRTIRSSKQQLSATVPENKLLQLHLSQLCQQDPESAISRQLPEEPLSASGLRTAAWPATVQSDQLSFSKKKLAEQDLANISLEEFFPKNFGKQLSAQQLQKNTFQQLSFYHPSFTEKTLNKELATNFAKNSLIDNLVFQNFFFATLALQKAASEQLGENNLYKNQLAEGNFTQTEEEACKEQLLTTGFPKASLNQQPFRNSLVQQSGAKAASHPELLQRELPEEELADQNFDQNTLAATSLPTRPSARQLQKDQLAEENFTENSFEALCLTSFPGTACKGELLQEQLLQQQLSSSNFQEDSFSASSLPEESFRTGTSQTAAFRTELSDRQLQRQQLHRSNFQHSSFEKNSFANNSFQKTGFDNYTLEKTSFKDKSLAEKSFEENSFAKHSSTKSSFAAASFTDTSLEETSFADSNFQEATFKEASFQEDSFAETSLKEETFYNTSLEKKTFPEHSFLGDSSFEKSSLEKSSLEKRAALH